MDQTFKKEKIHIHFTNLIWLSLAYGWFHNPLVDGLVDKKNTHQQLLSVNDFSLSIVEFSGFLSQLFHAEEPQVTIDMIFSGKFEACWSFLILLKCWTYMGVSKNKSTPKWMVYNGKPLLKWMIWGYPYFWTHPYIDRCVFKVDIC